MKNAAGGEEKKKNDVFLSFMASRRGALKKVLSNLQRGGGTVWRAAKPAVNRQRHDIINTVVGAEIRHRSLVLCDFGGVGSPAMTTGQDLAQKTL